eukprot:3455230-Rhodomonas_salina.1
MHPHNFLATGQFPRARTPPHHSFSSRLHGAYTRPGTGNRVLVSLTLFVEPDDCRWPPYLLIFNGSYCTAEGHFCHYSIHVCRNGQWSEFALLAGCLLAAGCSGAGVCALRSSHSEERAQSREHRAQRREQRAERRALRRDRREAQMR